MRDKHIRCLGELHAIFAHIRAIGAFITSSGLDEAWIESESFNNDCVVQQVIECKHMKRAIEAHEASMITVEILQLSKMVKFYPELLANREILNAIIKARTGLERKDDPSSYRSAFIEFLNIFEDTKPREQWSKFQ